MFVDFSRKIILRIFFCTLKRENIFDFWFSFYSGLCLKSDCHDSTVRKLNIFVALDFYDSEYSIFNNLCGAEALSAAKPRVTCLFFKF